MFECGLFFYNLGNLQCNNKNVLVKKRKYVKIAYVTLVSYDCVFVLTGASMCVCARACVSACAFVCVPFENDQSG